MTLPLRQPPPTATAAPWGTRAQLGATVRELDDLLGNQDGLWDNETGQEGVVGARIVARPAALALRAASSTGLQTTDEQARLAAALAECEEAWGCPVSGLDLSALPGGALFAVQTALLLVRWGRHPRELRDTVVWAEGGVAGADIAPREVFVRRFAPTGRPSGTAVVLVPGHAVGSAGAMAQINALNARGHAVFAMDHQWTGRSGADPGQLDRGLGLVRDLAAVVAAVHRHEGPARLALLAHSTGAGMAALGLVMLHADGALGSWQLPPALPTVLESPHLGAGWCFADPDAPPSAGGSRRPDIAALAGGHATVAARATQLAVLEHARVPRRLADRLEADLEGVLRRVADGVQPQGALAIVHARADPYADPQLARHLASALGARLHLRAADHHLLCLDPAHELAAVEALDGLLCTGPACALSPAARFGAARDRTLRFSVLAARAAAGEPVLPDHAQDLHYLTVPGLFTERYPGYMRAKFGRMGQLGLDHALAPVDTDASIETNAAVLRDTLLGTDPGRPVVLLGHSKGGVDIAAALALFPELQDRVHAVITLQAPYRGTPIGDLVADRTVLSWAARFIVEGAFQGEAAALTGLGLRAREAFIANHPWPEHVPAVCFASSLRSWSTALRVPDVVLAQSHGPTDGLVPLAHAVLPGADAVFLRDVDHGGPVLPRPLGSCAHLDPGDVTTALIALALERAAER